MELAPKAAPRIGQLLASNEALLSTAVPRLLQPEPITGADPKVAMRPRSNRV